MPQSRSPARIAIVTPVHDDWSCLKMLLEELDNELAGTYASILLIAVDDGSVEPGPDRIEAKYKAIDRVEILRSAVSLGHQRAIAIGLAYAAEHEPDCVIVMDADGEDRPADVLALLERYSSDPDTIQVAERAKRSESLSFKMFYFLYRTLFWLGTGKKISHGNFCLIPGSRLGSILYRADTWNNLAASIARSRIPYRGLPTARGLRYFGRSKMNFTSLLLHGLSVVSVYLDVFTARILTLCVILLGVLLFIGLGVVSIRLLTELAIPGWTTYTIGLLLVIMLQLMMLSGSVLFSLLHARNHPSVIPISVARQYIQSVKKVFSSAREREAA